MLEMACICQQVINNIVGVKAHPEYWPRRNTSGYHLVSNLESIHNFLKKNFTLYFLKYIYWYNSHYQWNYVHIIELIHINLKHYMAHNYLKDKKNPSNYFYFR